MQKVGSASPHPIYQHSPSPRYHPHSQREDLGDVEYEQEQFEERPVNRMMLPKSHKVPNEEKDESSSFQNDRTGQFDEMTGSKQGDIKEDRNNLLSDEKQEWNPSSNKEIWREENNDEGSLNRNDEQVFSSDSNKRYNDEGSLNRNDEQFFSSDSNKRYNDEGSRNRNDEQFFSSDSNKRYNDEGSRNRNDEQDVSDTNKNWGQADAGYNFDRKDNQEERKESGDDNEVFPNLNKEDESALIEAGPPPEKQWSSDKNTKEDKTNFEGKQSTVPQNRSRFEEKEDKIHRDIWNQPNPRAQNPEEWGKDVGDIESSNKSFDDRSRVHFQERGTAHLTGTWNKDQNQGQKNVSQQQQRSQQTKDPTNVTIAGVMAMTVPTDEFAPTDADLMLERERLARLQSETARLHGGIIPKGSNVSDAQSNIARKELDKDQGIDKQTVTVPIVMKGETDLHHTRNEKETESQRLHHIHDDVMEEIRGGTHLDSFDRK
jgi:hypothetical protein